jgi:hypothetical protein
MIGGVELRKQRNLGDIVSDAFTILFAAWKPLALVVLPVVAFTVAVQLIIYAVGDDISDAAFRQAEFQEKLDDWTQRLEDDSSAGLDWDISPISVITIVLAIPIYFVVTVLAAGGLVIYLDRADKGDTLTSSDALDESQNKLGPLIGATFRASVILFLLYITIIGIPFMLYRLVRWCYLVMVVVIENVSGSRVLARSAELVQGNWWNTLGRLLVVYLVISIPTGILSQALSAAFPGVGGILLSSVTGFVTTPFAIIGVTLMYFDRYTRKAPAHDDDAVPNPA